MSWRLDSSSDRLPLQDYSGFLAQVIRSAYRFPDDSLRHIFVPTSRKGGEKWEASLEPRTLRVLHEDRSALWPGFVDDVERCFCCPTKAAETR